MAAGLSFKGCAGLCSGIAVWLSCWCAHGLSFVGAAQGEDGGAGKALKGVIAGWYVQIGMRDLKTSPWGS